MNKKMLLFSATLGIAYLGITSYKAGPFSWEGNITGSGAKSASCSGAGCHAAGNAANTSASYPATGIVTLHTAATALPGSMLIGGYVPGQKYYVRLGAKNNNGLTKFGFQASCVSGTTTKVNAGTLAAIAGSNTAVRTGTINVIEQTSALSASSIFEFVSIFEWTAPPAGTGDVTFYVMVNAVNGNGNESGDQPSVGMTKTFYEKTTSINEVKNNIASRIYPNPCSGVLNIEAANNSHFMTSIYDLTGRQVIAPSHQNSVDVSALSAGVYVLRLNTEEGQQVSTFVKQ